MASGMNVRVDGPPGPDFPGKDRQIRDNCRQTLTRLALLVHRDALANAPISPTQATLNGLRKTTRVVTRKATATSRPKPGGLMRSIAFRVSDGSAEIFVAANSEAGRYAFRMHEEKGKSWWNRGPGTVAKGSRADEKFITRAIEANKDLIRDALHKGVLR
jgi:hypothetical protein